MSRLDDAFKPDYKALTTPVIGRPGSGKSYWLKHSIRDFMRSHKDPNYRLVYVCPKHEMGLYDKNKPIGVDSLEKHLRKDVLTALSLCRLPSSVFLKDFFRSVKTNFYSKKDSKKRNFLVFQAEKV